MPIVCMVSRKGGVGKTTLTLALADFLSALHARNILVIDVDPQSSASVALLGEDAWKVTDDARHTVADIFEGAIQRGAPNLPNPADFIFDAPRIKGATGVVHVIPSSPRLQDAEENALATMPLWSPYAGSAYLILHRALFAHVIHTYDYVLLDCPPSMGLVTLNALAISTGYLIPTIADYVSTTGLTQVTTKVLEHAQGLRRAIPLHGTIVNRFKRASRLHHTILAELRGRPEAQPLWDVIIPDTVRSEEAIRSDAGVLTLKQRYGGLSDALYPSFTALATEFLQRVS